MIGQIQIFILDRTPESFDKDIVKDPPAPIHANLHPSHFEPFRKRRTGKLTALIKKGDATLFLYCTLKFKFEGGVKCICRRQRSQAKTTKRPTAVQKPWAINQLGG